MSTETAGWIVLLTSLYFAVGSGFAVLFAAFGITRIDSKAHESGWGFRLLCVPGAVALWPFLAYRWARILGAR